MAPSKIALASLRDIFSLTSNTVDIGNAVDVSAYLMLQGRVMFGRATGTVLTTGIELRIEGTSKVSPTHQDWYPIWIGRPHIGVATIGSTAVNATETSPNTTITLTSGTNFAAGQLIFFHHPTLANSEWNRIVSVATNDIVIEASIVNTQTTATVRNQAEILPFELNVAALQAVRLVSSGAGSGQAAIIRADFGALQALAA